MKNQSLSKMTFTSVVLALMPLSQAALADLSQPVVSKQTTDCPASEKAPAGPYKGYCMDLDTDRPARRISPLQVESLTQTLNDPELLTTNNSGQTMVLENYLYHDHFYRAVIPVAAIHQVIYEMIEIAPSKFTLPVVQLKIPNPGLVKVYHGQLRFQLDRRSSSAVELIDAANKAIKLPASEVQSDFVYALWALRVKGHEEVFSPIDGAKGAYGVSYSVQSLYDAVNWVIGADLSSTQYLLNLSPQQSQALFRTAIRNAEQKGTSTVYNTFYNNCLNATFDVLVPVFHTQDAEVPSDNSDMLIRHRESLFPKDVAEQWGMFNNDKELPTISEELEGPLHLKPAPSTED